MTGKVTQKFAEDKPSAQPSTSSTVPSPTSSQVSALTSAVAPDTASSAVPTLTSAAVPDPDSSVVSSQHFLLKS